MCLLRGGDGGAAHEVEMAAGSMPHRLEVFQSEGGFAGSWMAGVGIKSDTHRRLILVRYGWLGADEAIEAWAPEERVRPQPPSPPVDFLDTLKEGTAVEFMRDGAFWLAQVERVHSSQQGTEGGFATYTIRDICGRIMEKVNLASLRPAWYWSPGNGSHALATTREDPTKCIQANVPPEGWLLLFSFQDALKLHERFTLGDRVLACRNGDCLRHQRLVMPSSGPSSRTPDTPNTPAMRSLDGVLHPVPETHETTETSPIGIEQWLRLGAEVEYMQCGTGPCCVGWTAGEVIKLTSSGEPIHTVPVSSSLSAATTTALIRTRLSCEVGPYSPGGVLVLTERVPITAVQPRPPPPPANFLVHPKVGMLLQLRWRGAWLDVRLRAIHDHPVNASQCHVKPGELDLQTDGVLHSSPAEEDGEGASDKLSAASTETLSGTVLRDDSAFEVFGAAFSVPRYEVEALGCGGPHEEVPASMLRPAWRWGGERHWSIAGSECSTTNETPLAMVTGAPTAIPLFAEHSWMCSSSHPPMHANQTLPCVSPSMGLLLRGVGASEVPGMRIRMWIPLPTVKDSGRQVDQRKVHGCNRPNCTARRSSWCEVSSAVGTVLGVDAEHGLAVRVGNERDGCIWVSPSAAWEWIPPDEAPHITTSEFEAQLDPKEEKSVSSCECCKPEMDRAKGKLNVQLKHADDATSLRKSSWHGCDTTGEGTPHATVDLGRRPPSSVSCQVGSNSSLRPESVVQPEVPRAEGGEVLKRGRYVELWGKEEGFFGSWYEAEVLDVHEGEAHVAVLEIWDEAGEEDKDGKADDGLPPPHRRLREWWPIQMMRPLPPSRSLHAKLSVGDHIDLRHEGGWWEVVVTSVKIDGAVGVIYEQANIHHVLPKEAIESGKVRPCWYWGEDASWTTWHQHVHNVGGGHSGRCAIGKSNDTSTFHSVRDPEALKPCGQIHPSHCHENPAWIIVADDDIAPSKSDVPPRLFNVSTPRHDGGDPCVNPLANHACPSRRPDGNLRPCGRSPPFFSQVSHLLSEHAVTQPAPPSMKRPSSDVTAGSLEDVASAPSGKRPKVDRVGYASAKSSSDTSLSTLDVAIDRSPASRCEPRGGVGDTASPYMPILSRALPRLWHGHLAKRASHSDNLPSMLSVWPLLRAAVESHTARRGSTDSMRLPAGLRASPALDKMLPRRLLLRAEPRLLICAPLRTRDGLPPLLERMSTLLHTKYSHPNSRKDKTRSLTPLGLTPTEARVKVTAISASMYPAGDCRVIGLLEPRGPHPSSGDSAEADAQAELIAAAAVRAHHLVGRGVQALEVLLSAVSVDSGSYGEAQLPSTSEVQFGALEQRVEAARRLLLASLLEIALTSNVAEKLGENALANWHNVDESKAAHALSDVLVLVHVTRSDESWWRRQGFVEPRKLPTCSARSFALHAAARNGGTSPIERFCPDVCYAPLLLAILAKPGLDYLGTAMSKREDANCNGVHGKP